MSKPPRVWISNRRPAKGETVTVRTMMSHPMRAGLRQGADGQPARRDIVNRFECRLGDQPLLEWRPETAISENPYLEFRFIASPPGPLHLIWTDDQGQVIKMTEDFDPV